MRLDASPPLSEQELLAVRSALARAGVRVGSKAPAYESAWRVAGLREGVDDEAAEVAYAFSPRSTRGATRA